MAKRVGADWPEFSGRVNAVVAHAVANADGGGQS